VAYWNYDSEWLTPPYIPLWRIFGTELRNFINWNNDTARLTLISNSFPARRRNPKPASEGCGYCCSPRNSPFRLEITYEGQKLLKNLRSQGFFTRSRSISCTEVTAKYKPYHPNPAKPQFHNKNILDHAREDVSATGQSDFRYSLPVPCRIEAPPWTEYYELHVHEMKGGSQRMELQFLVETCDLFVYINLQFYGFQFEEVRKDFRCKYLSLPTANISLWRPGA